MKTFNLSAQVTVTAYTTVKAETLEEAIEIAESREVVIGGIGTGTEPDEQWIIDDADGSPMNIHD